MANQLFLNSLEVRNFRGFEHLKIESLGRVNLVVGKNNVGKTSLLEALWLYAHRGSRIVIQRMLDGRDEVSRQAARDNGKERNIENEVATFERLFYRRRSGRKGFPSIQIGPIGEGGKSMSIALRWYRKQENGQMDFVTEDFRQGELDENLSAGLEIRLGQKESFYPAGGPIFAFHKRLVDEPCFFIKANGLDNSEIGVLWDEISLTDLEEEVLAGLRIIAPSLDRLNLKGDQKQERVPFVKMRDLDEPVPLRSLGDGMNRLFELTLGLVNAKDKILLIDEIENGLHYSVQYNVWHLVFEVARRLNVQVFAATHSWDCITSFQEAAREREQDDGVLIRLTEKGDGIVADLFNEDDLDVVTREGIEVR
jgi:hypothetical protein